MKRIIFALILFLTCASCFIAIAQERVTRVILKNGTVLAGELVEFDPTSYLVLKIAGIESRIDMDKVASVQADANVSSTALASEYEKFVEDLNVPDSIALRVGEEIIPMILFHGGDFKVGYNGRHSVAWDSEPIHKVRLNSFYVSKQAITSDQAAVILGKKSTWANSFKGIYRVYIWSQANDLVTKLAEMVDLPVRLITESEWEVIATSDVAETLIWRSGDYEWCYDYYDDYPEDGQLLINPTGPASGNRHVLRVWDYHNSAVYSRKKEQNVDSPANIRIVLPAAEYK